MIQRHKKLILFSIYCTAKLYFFEAAVFWTQEPPFEIPREALIWFFMFFPLYACSMENFIFKLFITVN